MIAYVKHGVTGYGPELGPDDVPADGVREVCEAIRWELSSDVDTLEDTASALAESGDYRGAWEAHTRADELLTLAMNLDYDRRATAPLYADDVPALEATMLRIIREAFPLEISSGPAVTLYAWEPTE